MPPPQQTDQEIQALRDQLLDQRLEQIWKEMGRMTRRQGNIYRRSIRLERKVDMLQVERKTRKALMGTIAAAAGMGLTLFVEWWKK
jgi:ferric-dicitrate binding protein FerR (iron transport regulator)